MATGSAEQAVTQAPGKAAGGIRGFFQRLRHAPPWVWIAILVALVGVVIAFAQLRKSQQQQNGTASGATDTSAGSVPSGGTGQPNWPAGDMTGFQTDNNAALDALLQYILSLQTPNPPPTAQPPAPPPPTPTPPPIFQRMPPVQSPPSSGGSGSGGSGNGGGGSTSGLFQQITGGAFKGGNGILTKLGGGGNGRNRMPPQPAPNPNGFHRMPPHPNPFPQRIGG